MTEIKFGWRNLNKKFYFIQDKRDGIIKDYNWENFSVSDFERGSDAINTYTSTDDPVTFSYAPENSFKYSLDQTEVNGTTFISFDSSVCYPSGATGRFGGKRIVVYRKFSNCRSIWGIGIVDKYM